MVLTIDRLVLVDGQHRIRFEANSDAMSMLIPFVVVDSEYDGGGNVYSQRLTCRVRIWQFYTNYLCFEVGKSPSN